MSTELTTTEQKEISLQDILKLNEFSNLDGLLNNELIELDQLYGLSKDLLIKEAGIEDSNKPKRLGSQEASMKRNMMFISNQTANLISLKKLKLDLIRQKSDLKQDMLDRNIKTIVQLNKQNSADDGELSSSNLLSYLVNVLNVSPSNTTNIYHQDRDTVDTELEGMLYLDDNSDDSSYDNNNLSTQQDNNINNNEISEKIVYYTNSERFFLVDNNYDVIKELGEEDLDLQYTDETEQTIIDNNTGIVIENVDDE